MNYMKLIKLLYLADREALSLWARSITGDTYVSMDKGPVLSKTLDKINSGKEPSTESYWHKFITAPSSYNVSVKNIEKLSDNLSPKEKQVLDIIFKKYKDKDQWKMVDICHEKLPEWQDPQGTSIPIRVDDILKALNKTESEIASIEDEVSNLDYVKSILSSLPPKCTIKCEVRPKEKAKSTYRSAACI